MAWNATLSSAALLLLLASGWWPASLQEPIRVWVNLRSGAYHCPGTEFYGKTARGTYLPEPVARQRGYRPASGRPCSEPFSGPTGPKPSEEGDPPGAVPTLLPDSGPSAPVATGPCHLTRIVDGDTVHCADVGAVRLIGVDAPELDQEPFGTAATAALAALVPVGSTLRLERDAEAQDRHRRQLAYLWHDGVLINWLLVRQGWAVSLRIAPNTRYGDWLLTAERRAAAERRGLWQVDGFRCRPADRRARTC